MKFGISILFVLAGLFNATIASEHFAEEINLSVFPNQNYGYTTQAFEDGIDLSYTSLESDYSENDVHEIAPLTTNIKCDKSVTIKRSMQKTLNGKNLAFQIYDHKSNSGKINLIILEKDTQCEMNFKILDKAKKITIFPFNSLLNQLWTPNTSTIDVEEAINLADGVEAINKRIEMLTGSKVSKNLIEARDPAMPLDFSKMPKYDFILFSTLQFNNDYVSNIMFKALAAHAKKGTPVVVVCNTRLVGAKEQGLLNWLQAQSPLIKIMKYEYFPDQQGINEVINKIHRVSHVKVFLTYSKDHPELNHLIFGGRNNSDRYFFPEFKKLEDPQYTQFDKELFNSWAFFYDLEFYIKSTKMVKTVLTTMMNYLKLDTSNSNMATDNKEDELQFLISIPFKDNHVMEKKYVAAINQATKIIRILSPYIYFTDDIDAALKKAYERGVRIEVITSGSLIGDDMTKSIKGVYDKFSGQRKHYIDTFAYSAESDIVMHRKAMMIDEKLLMLGSVNLSKRSFYHDVEDNFTITNSAIINSFLETYKKELAASEIMVKDARSTLTEGMIHLLNKEDML